MDRIVVTEEMGLEMIKDMLNLQYFSSMLGMTNSTYTKKSVRFENQNVTAKFTQEQIYKINEALLITADMLKQVELTPANCFDTLKVLSKKIKMPYLLLSWGKQKVG